MNTTEQDRGGKANVVTQAEIADLSAKVKESLARCRDARDRSVLSLLRLAACGILEAHELPPAERHMERVRVSYDYLIGLRDRAAREGWMTEVELLKEPLSCVEELIDMGREMLSENPQP